eukprot:TRINITY_DN4807_c0_g1_i1.p4 TRINITY_DN4807_c0_g1~~TRINITY_DN4807_c0_g1_i1.p4  ORF type:complete len:203 (-),score=94.87 TRINITY_DN4807_c0_g1_i1:49-657(-)
MADSTAPTPRIVERERKTKETDISLRLNLDGRGVVECSTGVPFFDHMLDAFGKHGGFDLTVRCVGDLDVGSHHTVEDVAIVLGEAFLEAVGDKRGITRFGTSHVPMDETLCRAVVDISNRPFAVVNTLVQREMIGSLECEMVPHFFQTFATEARVTLHVDVLRSENKHHEVEAMFKATARALREAVARSGDLSSVPSTKGLL